MSVISKEIKYYGSANMPSDDVQSAGGALDATTKIEFAQMTTTGVLDAWTSNADTPTLAVTGRDSTGVIVDDSIVLTGQTKATGSQSFERILKATLTGTSTGTVSAGNTGGGTNILEMEGGIDELRVPFYNVAADAPGGSQRDYYEKIFVRNTNEVTALTTSTITEVATGADEVITFAISGPSDVSTGDANSITNRVTAPTNVNFQSGTVSISGAGASDTLAPCGIQGIWINLTLVAGTAARKDIYVLRTQGNSV